MNSKKRADCTSRYKGVYWDRKNAKWRVQLRVKGKCHLPGRFDNEREAAIVYNKMARECFGEFARLNVMLTPARE